MIDREFSVPIAVTMALVVIASLILSGCSTPMRCTQASLLDTRQEIEICERKVCRDLSNGKLVRCP